MTTSYEIVYEESPVTEVKSYITLNGYINRVEEKTGTRLNAGFANRFSDKVKSELEPEDNRMSRGDMCYFLVTDLDSCWEKTEQEVEQER